MRSRARAPRIPRQLSRGRKVLDGLTGEELFEFGPDTRFQRGMFVHKDNYDTLLDSERQYPGGRRANADQWNRELTDELLPSDSNAQILETEEDQDFITEEGEELELE